MVDDEKSGIVIPGEIVEELDKHFGTMFDLTNSTMFLYEMDTHESAWVALTNLRDAFVHFVKIYKILRGTKNSDNDGLDFDMGYQRSEIYSHIRRALVETMENHVSKLLEMLEIRANLITKCQRLGLSVPEKKEIVFIKDKVKEILVDSRGMKSDYWQQCALNCCVKHVHSEDHLHSETA